MNVNLNVCPKGKYFGPRPSSKSHSTSLKRKKKTGVWCEGTHSLMQEPRIGTYYAPYALSASLNWE